MLTGYQCQVLDASHRPSSCAVKEHALLARMRYPQRCTATHAVCVQFRNVAATVEPDFHAALPSGAKPPRRNYEDVPIGGAKGIRTPHFGELELNHFGEQSWELDRVRALKVDHCRWQSTAHNLAAITEDRRCGIDVRSAYASA